MVTSAKDTRHPMYPPSVYKTDFTFTNNKRLKQQITWFLENVNHSLTSVTLQFSQPVTYKNITTHSSPPNTITIFAVVC